MYTICTLQAQFLPTGFLATAVNGVRSIVSTSHKVRRKVNKSNENSDQLEIICLDSFKQAVKNCTELNLLELNRVEKTSPLPLHWHKTYVSSNSFFENKYGFPEKNIRNCAALNVRRLINSSSVSPKILTPSSSVLVSQQWRCFKTRVHKGTSLRSSSIDSLNADSSSLSDRIYAMIKNKTKGLQCSHGTWKPGSSWSHEETVILSEETKQKLGGNESQARLHEIISGSTLNETDKGKIKVAFAEGYSEGMKHKPTSKRLRDVIIIIAAAIITLSLMSGSLKVALGLRTNEIHPEDIEVSFDDVRGIEEAKHELMEVVEFLKNPEKFSALGGKLPKGVLLVGPPGTGKTLLARAVAGEANVPFFHAAGSEFDEMLVGQGARRVRDLFATAKARAPCVVFIDEMDSVGAKRSNSVLHPYANQTINQLLSEMDGFRKNEGVIVLGATNRREELDRALLRPGRFDVEVQVPNPDFEGRVDILKLYLSKIKMAADIDINKLARGTTGFTGADIESLVNQAALRASADGALAVSMECLENARDKVLMGPERKCRIPDDDANKITAFHEGGHALVAIYTKDASPVHKVTIIPRGPSLGHTAYIPEKENYHFSKSQMLATLDTLMGGRAAEELIFGSDNVTSGSADDLKKATQLATHMVKDFGMSEKVGLRSFIEEESLIKVNDLGQATSQLIDSEIKQILSDSFERAKNILKIHRLEHTMIADALMKYETLNAEDLKNIIGSEKQ